MSGIINSTGAKSGVIGTTVGTPAGGLDGVTTGSGNVTITNGDLIVGTSGKGIDFSATSDVGGMTSELLDDYEEGTYTPHLNGSTTTYTGSNHGRYQKVGNTVHCQFAIGIDDLGDAPVISKFHGMPFDTVDIGKVQTGCVSYFANLDTSVTFLAFYLENNLDTGLFISSTGSASGTCQNAPNIFKDDTILYGSITYRTD